MALSSSKDVQSCAGFMQPGFAEPSSAVAARADAWAGTGGMSAFAVRITTGGAPYAAAVDFWFLHNGTASTSPKPENRIVVALDRIRQAFGLNVTELACVCGVERKMIYQWRGDATPRDSKLKRIFMLERAANSWIEDGFPVPGVRLKEPLLDGRSIFDLLSGELIDLDAIHFAGSRVHLDAQISASDSLKDPFG